MHPIHPASDHSGAKDERDPLVIVISRGATEKTTLGIDTGNSPMRWVIRRWELVWVGPQLHWHCETAMWLTDTEVQGLGDAHDRLLEIHHERLRSGREEEAPQRQFCVSDGIYVTVSSSDIDITLSAGKSTIHVERDMWDDIFRIARYILSGEISRAKYVGDGIYMKPGFASVVIYTSDGMQESNHIQVDAMGVEAMAQRVGDIMVMNL